MALQNALREYLSADKLPSWFPLHHFTEPPVYEFETLGSMKLVDFTQPSLWAAVGMVLFNPVFWNVVARNGEWAYRHFPVTEHMGRVTSGCHGNPVLRLQHGG